MSGQSGLLRGFTGRSFMPLGTVKPPPSPPQTSNCTKRPTSGTRCQRQEPLPPRKSSTTGRRAKGDPARPLPQSRRPVRAGRAGPGATSPPTHAHPCPARRAELGRVYRPQKATATGMQFIDDTQFQVNTKGFFRLMILLPPQKGYDCYDTVTKKTRRRKPGQASSTSTVQDSNPLSPPA